jgi:hypothetical protein
LLTVAAVGCFVGVLRAQVVLIDLNTQVLEGGGPGGTWNAYAVPTDINGSTVVNSAGGSTGITLSRSGTFTDGTNSGDASTFDNNALGLEGLPSWATSTTDNSASGDFFYTSNGGTTIHSFQLIFGGLTPGQTFSLDMLASRNTSLARGFYEYSLNGGGSWLGLNVLNGDGTPATDLGWNATNTKDQAFQNDVDGYANHRYMNVSNIALIGTTLAVRTTDANPLTGNFSVVNAIRLSVVPEPASTLFLLLSGASLLALRRRH